MIDSKEPHLNPPEMQPRKNRKLRSNTCSLTKYMRLFYVIVPALLLTACTPKWLNPSGARALRYDNIPEIFYYTDSRRTNAYLYFRLSGLIVTGMSTSSRWDAGAENLSVGFGVVRDTPESQRLYPMDTQLGCWRDGDYWVKRFDINVGRHGPTDDVFKMFYPSRDDLMGIELAFKGTRNMSEPDGAANGSQPIRSETSSTSSAAGSRR